MLDIPRAAYGRISRISKEAKAHKIPYPTGYINGVCNIVASAIKARKYPKQSIRPPDPTNSAKLDSYSLLYISILTFLIKTLFRLE